MMFCYILICFLTLICHSMGKTTEDLSLSDDKQITTLDSLLNDNQQVGDNNSTSSVKQIDNNNSASSGKQVDDNNSARFEKQDNEKDRSGQSRMLSLQKLFTTTTTTVKPTVHDYWSFFTTPKRPLISYRDYPGKPGVATWKEISSTAVKDNQKDRKIENPTAASVSSSAPRWPARYCFPAILILLNFYVIYDGRVGRNFGTFS